MRKAMLGLSIVLLVVVSSFARAADVPHGANGAPSLHGEVDAAPSHRPVLPVESPLPGTTIILILGLFLAAAAVGPVVRYHAPEEVPDASSHDAHGVGAHDEHGHQTHGHGH